MKIHGTSACLLSSTKIAERFFFFLNNLSGFHSVCNAAFSALLLPKNDSLLFSGPLKLSSCIIASVDHADYSWYLSAVKALHSLPTPYKSISSKACLCTRPSSFPSDDECATFFIETGKGRNFSAVRTFWYCSATLRGKQMSKIKAGWGWYKRRGAGGEKKIKYFQKKNSFFTI